MLLFRRHRPHGRHFIQRVAIVDLPPATEVCPAGDKPPLIQLLDGLAYRADCDATSVGYGSLAGKAAVCPVVAATQIAVDDEFGGCELLAKNLVLDNKEILSFHCFSFHDRILLILFTR